MADRDDQRQQLEVPDLRAGTFAYHCSIHRQMTATLVVTAAAPATDTAPTTDADDVGDPGPGVLLVVLGAVIGLVAGGRRFARRA